jgi:hypothetical protein
MSFTIKWVKRLEFAIHEWLLTYVFLNKDVVTKPNHKTQDALLWRWNTQRICDKQKNKKPISCYQDMMKYIFHIWPIPNIKSIYPNNLLTFWINSIHLSMVRIIHNNILVNLFPFSTIEHYPWNPSYHRYVDNLL